MVLQDILRLVEQDGYQRVASNLPELCLYHKTVQEKSLYLLITDTNMNGSQSPQAVRGLMLQISYKLKQRDGAFEFLTMVVTDQTERYRELVDLEGVVWLIDRTQPRLMVYEEQKECFAELRMAVEHMFDHYYSVGQSFTKNVNGQESQITDAKGDHSIRSRSREMFSKWPVACSILVVLNIVVYLISRHMWGMTGYSEIMYQFGVRWSAVVQKKEYYRLITYMFLHFSTEHLFNNMLVLFFVGKTLESVVPKVKFLVIYFGAGIIAGIVSLEYNMLQDHNVLSAGASGAIFGIIGAMLYVVLINRGKLCNISTRQILLFVAFSLYGGFASSNVDNAAHIGGFVAGIVLAAILIRREGKKRGKVSEG